MHVIVLLQVVSSVRSCTVISFAELQLLQEAAVHTIVHCRLQSREPKPTTSQSRLPPRTHTRLDSQRSRSRRNRSHLQRMRR